MFSRSRSVTSRRNREFFELEFGNSVVGAARPMGLFRLGGHHQYGLRPRRRLAPPVQGHDANAKCARNFTLRFPLRRQFICLRQLRRDFQPRVPFPFSHSSLHSTLPMLLPQIFCCGVGATKQRVVPCPWQPFIALQINMRGGALLGMECETCV